MNEYLCGYVEHLNENQWELYKGLARTKEAQFFEQRGMEHHRIDLPTQRRIKRPVVYGSQ